MAALIPTPVLLLLAHMNTREQLSDNVLGFELVTRIYREDLGWWTAAAFRRVAAFWVPTRDRWPEGARVYFDTLSLPWAVGQWPEPETTVLWDAPEVDEPSHEMTWHEPCRYFDGLATGQHDLPFRILLDSGETTRIVRTIHVGGAVDSCITPIVSPEADSAVRTWLSPRILIQPSSQRLVAQFVPSRMLRLKQPFDQRTAVALKVELIRDGHVVTSSCWLILSDAYPVLLESGGGTELNGLKAAMQVADNAELARWKLRVHGDGELALRDFWAEAYWSGALEWKVADILK